MTNSILVFLFGMLAGYMVATFYVASMLVKKGYRTFDEIEDKNGKD